MKFINKYNNKNFSNKLASLINFNNNSNFENNFDNNINTHIAISLSDRMKKRKITPKLDNTSTTPPEANSSDISNLNLDMPEMLSDIDLEEPPKLDLNESEEISNNNQQSNININEKVNEKNISKEPEMLSDIDLEEPPKLDLNESEEISNNNQQSNININKKTNDKTDKKTNNKTDDKTNNKTDNKTNDKADDKADDKFKEIDITKLKRRRPIIVNPPQKNLQEPSRINSSDINKLNLDEPETLPNLELNEPSKLDLTEPEEISDIDTDIDNNDEKEKEVSLTEKEKNDLSNLEQSDKSNNQASQLIQFLNDTNNEADNETQKQMEDTKNNLYSITDTLKKIIQQPEQYVISVDILNEIIPQEEAPNDALMQENTEMDKALTEKIEVKEKSTSTILLNEGVGAITTDKDQKILDALQGQIEIADQQNTTTDAAQLVKTTIDNIQNINLIPDITENETIETSNNPSQKITKLNTSFESKLQMTNDKVNANTINDIINTFTTSDELKQYILQQCDDDNRTILNSNSINNIFNLKQAVTTIYNIAFNNTSLANINNAFEMNITNIINKFLSTLYIEMFKQKDFRGNRNGDSIGDITIQSINTFIKNRLDPEIFYNGPNKTRIYPYYTPLDKDMNTLYQLINACALKFCIERRNNELQYDSTKDLTNLSTEQLFILKKAKKRNNNKLQDLKLDFTNAATFNKSGTILQYIDRNLKTLSTYTNNYSTQLRKLVTYKKDIQPGTAEHHKFERMSFKGFSKPLEWYDNANNILERLGQPIKKIIPKEIAASIRQIQMTVIDKNNKKSNVKFYTDLYLRYKLTLLYKKYIIPYLLEDIKKLRTAYDLLSTYQFTNKLYDQLYKELEQYGNNFFRISQFFNFTKDTIPIEYLDPYALKNQNLLESRQAALAKRLNNRILIRLAINFNNNIADNDLLIQFYQQPYAKYLISLLCSTKCASASNRRSFEEKNKNGIPNQYFLNMIKMKKYIIQYLHNNKNQLETLQTNIINTVKSLLQNNDKLINVLPKINLLEALDQIQIMDKIKETSFTNHKDIFKNETAIKNSYDFIGYIIWRFSRNGCTNNSEYKRNFRRYILQPLIMEQLNDRIFEYIQKYTKTVNDLYID